MPDATPLEKVYIVLSGSLTVKAGDIEVVLGPMDSCCIPASVMREVKNYARSWIDETGHTASNEPGIERFFEH